MWEQFVSKLKEIHPGINNFSFSFNDEYADEECSAYFDRDVLVIDLPSKSCRKTLPLISYRMLQNLIRRRIGFYKECLMYYFIILHEYGHYIYTSHPLYNTDEYNDAIDDLYLRFRNNQINERQFNLLFRQIPEEKWCDDYALNFIKEHIKEVIN